MKCRASNYFFPLQKGIIGFSTLEPTLNIVNFNFNHSSKATLNETLDI